MKISWIEENYNENRPFGRNICGLHRKHERPDKIVVYYDELFGKYNKEELLMYLKQLILATKQRKIEITWV